MSPSSQFEEWPVCPKKPSRASWEETDYVRVKPGVAAHSHDTGGEGEVGYTKKTIRENVSKNSEQSHDSEDEEDEVTYTHVTFKYRK